jgi:signal transduction histidine kinase
LPICVPRGCKRRATASKLNVLSPPHTMKPMTTLQQEPGSDSPPIAQQIGRPADLWERALLAAMGDRNRVASITIVAGFVAVVGMLDYITGVRVSLVLFYLIPIALSVPLLGWRAGIITSVTCAVVRVVGDLANGGYHYPIVASWNRLIDLFMYVVVVMILHALISVLREVDERVRQRTAALRQVIAERAQLQTELYEISRRERAAIGHDLHDGLGQHLTATSIAANMLANNLTAADHPTAKDARTVVKMLHDAIGTTRKIARGLLLAAVGPDELLPELDELASSLGQDFPIEFRFVHRGVTKDRLNAGVSSHIFYIAQEAARNAARHARATRVDISLLGNERGLALEITDNGRGLPSPNGRSSGIGQRIMAHRTELIGGEFTCGPGDDGGTTVRCLIPLPAAESAIVIK